MSRPLTLQQTRDAVQALFDAALAAMPPDLMQARWALAEQRNQALYALAYLEGVHRFINSTIEQVSNAPESTAVATTVVDTGALAAISQSSAPNESGPAS